MAELVNHSSKKENPDIISFTRDQFTSLRELLTKNGETYFRVHNLMDDALKNQVTFIVEEAEEGGYWAHSLSNEIFTQGETIEELREMIKEATLCAYGEDDAPRSIRVRFVKEEILTL